MKWNGRVQQKPEKAPFWPVFESYISKGSEGFWGFQGLRGQDGVSEHLICSEAVEQKAGSIHPKGLFEGRTATFLGPSAAQLKKGTCGLS
jgi:hypothetical protein